MKFQTHEIVRLLGGQINHKKEEFTNLSVLPLLRLRLEREEKLLWELM